jgi:hypothetical protein
MLKTKNKEALKWNILRNIEYYALRAASWVAYFTIVLLVYKSGDLLFYLERHPALGVLFTVIMALFWLFYKDVLGLFYHLPDKIENGAIITFIIAMLILSLVALFLFASAVMPFLPAPSDPYEDLIL